VVHHQCKGVESLIGVFPVPYLLLRDLVKHLKGYVTDPFVLMRLPALFSARPKNVPRGGRSIDTVLKLLILIHLQTQKDFNVVTEKGLRAVVKCLHEVHRFNAQSCQVLAERGPRCSLAGL